MSGNEPEAAAGSFVETNDGVDEDGGCVGGAAEGGGDGVGREEERPPPSAVAVGDVEEGSANDLSEPDYDYLAVSADDEDCVERQSDAGSGDVPSSPDYDHLDTSCGEELPSSSFHGSGGNANAREHVPMAACSNDEHPKPMPMGEYDSDCHPEEEDDADVGEEYILGTLMVRVLQAKNLKSNPNNEGGGVMGLLNNHRRFRHQKSTMSPLTGGNLTPSSYYANQSQQIYARLSYRDNAPQSTSVAMEHAHGDYHWSRGDQSYFDVTCPAFPTMAESRTHQDVLCKKANNTRQRSKSGRRRPPLPILQLSLYSKKNKNGAGTSHNKGDKWRPYLGNNEKENPNDNNDDYLLGNCSINVLRILSGKTPYFDEWCNLHDDADKSLSQKQQQQRHDRDERAAGRVRIVIEYEPSDPPPRPGDRCVFANAYPLAEELYPVPLRSIRNSVHSVRSSSTLSSMSAESRSSKTPSQSTPTCRPKRYLVEEVVGDHVVLSYRTPVENWTCTFEAHRYLLLCVERHQAFVEKYRERVLDLCDNVSQSPAMEVAVRTVEALPDEGLVHVGAGLMGGGADTLGRWWEAGVEGMVEDVVDGINLDGRHSRLPGVGEEGEDGDADDADAEVRGQEPVRDEGEAPPGMPCCPITGLAMVQPVVAADGHTYERRAIARWLQTSNRSPLTGEVMVHSELVPNYLLLSSLGNYVDEVGKEVGTEYVNNV